MLRINKMMLFARTVCVIIAGVLVFSYPLGTVVLAESSETDSTAAPASETGPISPTGADSSSYVFNPDTRLWENDYYTWDPATKQTSPKTPQSYSYNPDTNMWDTTQWVWDAPSNKYVPNILSSTNDASPAIDMPVPAQESSITNTGPDSNNTISQTQNNNGAFDLFYNASISNNSTSRAQTGDAAVASNTFGGNSTSGDASTVVNIINLLQSNWDPQGSNLPLMFTSNINGDVTGDLILDPNAINTTGPGSTATIDSQRNNNLTVNYDANGVITNNITLEAISGDSIVEGNSEAGDAASGDARVVANVINMINSAINAGQSFIGNININGNFDGDILLPPNFIDQLIAYSGPGSTVDLSRSINNDIVANIDNSQTINNNTSLNAATGSATVAGNTVGGSATTGDATTKLNVLNLTGKQVIDANTLLVFVNVLGQWVGMLVNAPSGSNSAAFCGGDCQISSLVDNNINIDAKSKFNITNNLDLDSLSGNALVSHNTLGGNAVSGNASASANIANILGSDLKATDWLGILFINVNGFWNGSFGINTAAGNPTVGATGGMGGGTAPAVAKVFQFVPGQGASDKFTVAPLFGGSTSSGGGSAQSQPTVPIASNKTLLDAASGTSAENKTVRSGGIPLWLTTSITAAVTLAIFSLGAATELYDKLWAASVARASKGKTKKTHKKAPARKWLTSLSWKLPLF